MEISSGWAALRLSSEEALVEISCKWVAVPSWHPNGKGSGSNGLPCIHEIVLDNVMDIIAG